MQPDEIEAKIVDRYSNSTLVVNHTEAANFKARLATELIERYGMIASETGEDFSGQQQRGRLLEPKQVVTRAVEIADIAVDTFRERGWMIKMPSISELFPSTEDE